ncbi:MAG TPA: hypothetical protein VI299_24980 [Polyangiales bacterium]
MQRHLLILAAVLFSACAADTTTDDHEESAQEGDAVGGLSLALRSTDSLGRTYRLRDATFTVEVDYYSYYYGYDGGVPPAPVVLSTETDPNADRLSVRLLPNQYRVTLGGNWYLERVSETGVERVQQAVLLSPAVQWAYINNDWYYDMAFRFGVDGTLIDFRHGDLNIDISIELPGQGPDAGGPPPWGWDAGTPFN